MRPTLIVALGAVALGAVAVAADVATGADAPLAFQLVTAVPRDTASDAVTASRGSVLKSTADRFTTSDIDVDLRGSVISASAPEVTEGINILPLTEDESFTLVCSDIDATRGGTYVDGKYYCIKSILFYTDVYFTYLYVYDADTWELLQSSSTVDNSCLGTDLAYDEFTENIYGCFYNTSLDGYLFGTIDFSSATVTTITERDTWYSGLAVGIDGTLYAIDSNGDLLIVDKTTGAETVVGNTGLWPQYLSSATIDPNTGRMFYSYYPNDRESWLYEIDITTAEATLLTPLFGNVEVCGLYVPDAATEALAPAAAQDVSVYFGAAALTGTLTFTAPTTTYDGTAASGDVDYTIIIDGIKTATGTTTYGSTVEVSVTVESDGIHVFGVVLTNSAGDSPKTKVKAYAGKDTPSAPENVTATNQGDDVVIVEWSPVTTGVNGGTINPEEVQYTVTRYDDDVVVATITGDTAIVDTLPAQTGIARYYYTVTAEVYSLTSEAGTSNYIDAGGNVPPYTNAFSSNTEFYEFTVIDANADGYTWSLYPFNSYYVRYSYSTKNTPDDWFISPPLLLEAGKYYELSFDVWTTSSTGAYSQDLTVYCGSRPAADAMTTTLIETFTTTGVESSPDHRAVYVKPESDGIYYIGFYVSKSTKVYNRLCLDNFDVAEGIWADGPDAVTDISIIPNADKEHNARISFTAPTKTFVGDTLTNLTKIEVSRDDELIKTFDSPNPGAALELTDTTGCAGWFTYSFVAYNSVGEGVVASDSAFIGVYIPAAVGSTATTETSTLGEVTIAWTAPVTDANGEDLDPSVVTYNIYDVTDGENAVVATGLTDTTYTYQALASTDHAFKQWTVYPVTEGGTGEGTVTELTVLGTPGDMPFRESFAGQAYSTTITADYLTASSGWTELRSDSYSSSIASVDNDDGYAQCSSTADNPASIVTGKIKVDGTSPIVSFWVYSASTTTNTIDVLVREVGGEWTALSTISLADCTAGEWSSQSASLSGYAGKTVQVRLDVNYSSSQYTYIDKIYIGNQYSYNLGVASISAPTAVDPDVPFTVDVMVDNTASNAVAAGAYTVELYRDGDKVRSATGVAVASLGLASVSLTDTLNSSFTEPVDYCATISYTADEYTADNTSSSVTVEVNLPDYPVVTTLTATKTSGGALLSWSAPDVSDYYYYTEYTETFDGFESFATSIDGWIFVDADSLPVTYPGGNITIPGISYLSLQSWFILDGSYTGFSSYDVYQARSGTKYLASLGLSTSTASGSRCDDWAISPLLYGGEQTISFYAKVPNEDYTEIFYVCYSSTGTDIDDFTSLYYSNNFYEQDTWTKISVTLPDGAKYFAIRKYSARGYGFILMVDDATYIPESSKANPVIKGYNIYRDGVKINSTLVTTTSYTDADYTGSGELYTVTVVYDLGESAAGNVAAVDASDATIDNSGIGKDVEAGDVMISVVDREIVISGAENRQVGVYAVDGKTVYSGIGEQPTMVSVDPGVYVVKAASKVAKIIVK